MGENSQDPPSSAVNPSLWMHTSEWAPILPEPGERPAG
jgi:hypothetical protein